MKIKHLVQKTFETVDAYAGIDSVERRLRGNSFLVVMDEGSFIGILTPSDIIESPHRLVIDCLHEKPRIDCGQDIESVLAIMKESRNYVLPVFKGNVFIGVVLQAAITDFLFEYHNELNKINKKLQLEIQERKRSEEELQESEERFRALFDSAHDCIFIKDIDLRYTMVNSSCEQHLGLPASKVIGRTGDEIFGEEISAHMMKINSQVLDGEEVDDEITFPVKGIPTTFNIILMPMRDSFGQIIGLCGIARDISNRKQAEKKLESILKEKELLLREVHHRVKNNLQIICSLLDMRRLRSGNLEAIDLITDIRAKVYTMSLIHSQLYRSDRFDQIDMQRQIHELVDYLSLIYSSRKMITPVIRVSDGHLSLNHALPCALILNELVSNAYKHAFKGRQQGTIEISMHKSVDGMVVIIIKDDGVGFSAEVDIYETNTLGLKLTRNLVQDQLKGNIQVKIDNGSEVLIEFKDLEEESKHA
jgi:PAS domain S-box-containing protein